MKTITFYSYKGGVGRSLALSNMAKRFSEYNKKVCVLDFDLEAPGLQFKFNGYRQPKIERGIVDYIHEFCLNNIHNEKIHKYVTTLNATNNIFAPIHFIPAGDINNNLYWRKLSEINWFDFFYSEESFGVKFFLELKKKIEKEICPDVLLIDSRTGITEISGITLKLLADEVVVFAANNDENIFGSQKIINSLIDTTKSFFNKTPKINFVLTRLPFTDKPGDREKELRIIQNIKQKLNITPSPDGFEILTIHSDRRLEEKESLLIGYEHQEKFASIENDYLRIFDKISDEILSDKEREDFKKTKVAEKEYLKSFQEDQILEKIKILNKAIDLDQSKFQYYLERGFAKFRIGQLAEAMEDYDIAYKLNPNEPYILINKGVAFIHIKKYKDAIAAFDNAIKIDGNSIPAYENLALCYQRLKNPEKALEILNHAIDDKNLSSANLYNSRADILRYFKKLKEASRDIFKAISIEPNNSVFFGTLAEINYAEGKIEEFYLNLTIALSKGIKAAELSTAKDIYEHVRNDERFTKLVSIYGIDPEDIFKEDLI